MHFKILGIEGATSLELVNTATKHLSLEELKACLVKTKLNQEQMKQILMNHGVSASEAEEMATVLAVSQAEMAATASTGALTTATGGLSAAFRGLTVAMASNPIGAIAVAAATVIGVVSTAVTVFSNWSNSIEDVKDKENELKNDFDSASNTISENTEKLKSLKSEFEKLSKGVSDYGENISLTGDEYERYKEIVQTILGISPSLIEGYDKEGTALANKNGLLEKSIALMEEEQRLEKEKLTRADNLNKLFNASKEDIKTARNDVNKIIRPDDISYTRIKTVIDGKEYGTVNDSILDFIQAIIGEDKDFSGNIADFIVKHYDEIYKHLNEIVDKSQQGIIDKIDDDNYSEIIAFTESQAESFRNYLLQFKDYIDTQDEVNSEFNSYLQLIPESMREYSGLNDSSKTFISEWIKKNFTIDENTTEQDIKDFSSKIRKFTKQIADDKDLQSLFDFGAELITDTDNESLSVEAYQNKVKEFIDKVNNLNDEDTKLYIKTVFGFEENDDDLAKDVSDKIKRVQNILVDADDDKVSGLSMQELNIAYNISAEEGSLTFDELQDKIKETAQKSKESAFELSETQTKQIKQINSNYDKLNKVYNDLFSKKEHSEIESDVWELVSSFPELYQYIDWTDEKFGNLAEGIDKVISGLSTDLVAELEAIDLSKLSDDGKKALQSIISVMKMMHPTLKTTVNLIEDIQKAIKGVSSSISTLIGFTKEISSDGSLSLSSIDTIMTDDTYQSLRPYINDMEGMQTAIAELVAKQKDAYEDLYNAEIYENDYEAYRAELDKKESQGEAYLSKSIKEIQDEIKNIEQQYGVDLTNWDNLSETKKTILQNTNAELLSKQASLINTFKSYYDTDLTNYKNTTAAKAAILDNFRKSEAFAQASKIATEEGNLHMYQGTLYLDGTDAQNKINSVLAASGLTWQDYVQYLNNGTFTSKGNEALQKTLDEIVKAYTITPSNWETITANIKSTGSSSSSSSSKNYIDWIERRLKKFAQNTKEIFARVADYISFNNQNSQLRKAINAIRDEIAVNEQSYQFYMEEANNVGLDPYWQWFVQNGARNISDIQDEVLKEKISRYKELYDQAIDCKNAVEDLKKTEKEYANQMLSNVEKYYSNRIDYANQDAEYYNSLDTDNLFMNKNFDAIRKSYNEQISYIQKEHDDLLNTLNSLVSNGSIKYQSDEWYEWWAKIQKCNVEVCNLKKSIHDLANEELQGIQNRWNNRIGVYDNTISYINTVGNDSTRKGSKNYKGLKNAYNSQIGYTNKQVSELQTRLDKAVKTGDIEKYSDKWYEWTGIIEQGKEKVAELQTSIHQLAIDEFNDITARYDNLINRIEHKNNLLEESISQIQEKGYIVSTKYYNALITNEQNNISKLSEKRNVLYSDLQQAIKSGNIQEGSEEWHQMVQEIENVDLAIEQANTSVIKFNNSIRDIQWQVFDLLQDRISQISAESNFLINLMKNDDLYVKKGQGAGQLTNQGLSTMGLHGVNYDVYMAQSNKYAQEILKIDKQLAKDPYNQTLINRRKELLKLQQDMIISANDEKQAIVSMVKDGIELELSSLKELIDKYNESLDKQKDLYEYQKKVKEQTKEITSLEKQMMAFDRDNSEETKAKVQQLKVDLETARENLQETQYDKFVSDSKKLLDDFYNDYETTLNKRLDNVDSLISDMISNINSNANTIQQTIIDSTNNVGYALSDSMNNILGNKSRLMLWEDVNVSNNNVIYAINDLTDSINQMIQVLDINSINTIGKYKKYKSGIHTINRNQMGWTNENGNSEVIIRRSDGAILTPLAKDDMILNGYATDNLFSMTNDPSKFIKDNLFGTNQYNGTSNINNVNSNYSVSVDNINLNLPNVKNYEDFFYAAQHDKRFEKMVQAMTVDKLFGGSSLKKYRV